MLKVLHERPQKSRRRQGAIDGLNLVDGAVCCKILKNPNNIDNSKSNSGKAKVYYLTSPYGVETKVTQELDWAAAYEQSPI
ncbi:hypothetical protein GBA52_022748 [Prunus armeniaca]|nr:hypothetical protein GBA52_022748 [Prunus armeniaca]